MLDLGLHSLDDVLDYLLQLLRHFMPKPMALRIFGVGICPGSLEVQIEEVFEEFGVFFIGFRWQIEQLLILYSEQAHFTLEDLHSSKKHIFFECLQTRIASIFLLEAFLLREQGPMVI